MSTESPLFLWNFGMSEASFVFSLLSNYQWSLSAKTSYLCPLLLCICGYKCLCAPLCSDMQPCKIWPGLAGDQHAAKKIVFLSYSEVSSLFDVIPFTVSLGFGANHRMHHTLSFTWWSCWPSLCYRSAPVPVYYQVAACARVNSNFFLFYRCMLTNGLQGFYKPSESFVHE